MPGEEKWKCTLVRFYIKVVLYHFKIDTIKLKLKMYKP